MTRIKYLTIAIAAAFAANASAAMAATGPSSSQTPYVTPTAAGWSVTSLLSVGDTAANGYKMVGIPDGLGAYDNGNGTFTLLMNHEIGNTLGAVRAHGGTGAFVSEWIIDKNTLKVQSGRDLIQTTNIWYADGNKYLTDNASTFNRFCSGDLPAASAYYNAASGKGTQSRIWMTGEESGANGRAFGVIATGASKGIAYELPKLGNSSWENALANPYSGDKTVVMLNDDTNPGQVYMYVGNKQSTGNDIEKAGLHNGNLYGIKVNNVAVESQATNGSGTFTLHNFGDVASTSGADLQTKSVTNSVTEFGRPEDGAWASATSYYFVTTGNYNQGTGAGVSSKLYRADFVDANDYTKGGTITMVKDTLSLTGTDGKSAYMWDNITVAEDGSLLLQEDPGNNSYVAKTWHFDPKTNIWTQVLESDRARFQTGGADFKTVDEENSGVIDITSVLGRKDGKRYFLADSQAHYGIPGELVEGGQLYLITQAAPVPEADTYAMMIAGLGLLGFAARRRNAK